MANERGFFDIEEGLNAALKKVGNNYSLEVTINDKEEINLKKRSKIGDTTEL